MKRVAELERLAKVARQQSHMTANREAREVLIEIADGFMAAATDRRVALASVQQLEQDSGRAADRQKS
jgi:hypothetical protein